MPFEPYKEQFNPAYIDDEVIDELNDRVNVLDNRLDSFEQETNETIDSLHDKIFVSGANLFNVATALSNKGVSSTNGTILDLNNFVTSDFIPVESSTNYTLKGRYVVVWYDENNQFISSSPSSESSIKTLTSPATAKYMRFSFTTASFNPSTMMVNKGDSLLLFEPYREQFNPAYIDDKNNGVDYGLEMVNIKITNASLIGNPTNLCLIATKVIWENGKTPNYTDLVS